MNSDHLPLLSHAGLAKLPLHVMQPSYDRRSLRNGIIHLGPGAFHRAHQAAYFDQMAHRDPRWGVTQISLKTAILREKLQPQDGLYCLATLDHETSFRLIGVVTAILAASGDQQAIEARAADPDLQAITLTVTEKGYCLNQDGSLNESHPDIEADLQDPLRPASSIGWLVRILDFRRRGRLAPPAVICCDNMTDNGQRVRRAVLALAQQTEPALAGWIAENVAFPSTMVDSITPATDDALIQRVAQQLGCRDAWPVQREAFTQWVITDGVPDQIRAWESAGVTFTAKISPFERAKLRLLNGTHSTLAYWGLLRGHETVRDTSADPMMAAAIQRLMRDDIAPSLDPSPSLDLGRYSQAIRTRYANPEIRHLLSQIAWDGSQKLPFRIFDTIKDGLAAGRDIARLTLPIAAWLAFIAREAKASRPITDPLAGRLLDWGRGAQGQDGDIDQFLAAMPGLLPQELAAAPSVLSAWKAHYATLCGDGDISRMRCWS